MVLLETKNQPTPIVTFIVWDESWIVYRIETCAGLGSSIHPQLGHIGFPMDGALDFCFLPDGGGGMDGLHHIQFRYLCSVTNIHIFVDTSAFTKRADSVCLGDHVMYEGDTNWEAPPSPPPLLFSLFCKPHWLRAKSGGGAEDRAWCK